MKLTPPEGREGYRFDLTRWNRAGLSRFQYVDGDAAVWLEELRIAMLGLYCRGVDPADRTPEKWRDLFMKPKAGRQLKTSAVEIETSSVWKDVFTAFPVEAETQGKRNKRLLEQYAVQSPDYAWEIMRAFARAAHILLGHLNAYANEGYLGTATQWENLRKLAAMVNYQPTPPASTTTTVALELETDKAVVEIDRGLAMKYAPPEGGAPLIFETLKPVQCHPQLNAVRREGWDYNTVRLNLNAKTQWHAPEEVKLAQGDLVVITSASGGSGFAVALKSVDHDTETQLAELTFHPGPGANRQTGNIVLRTEPDGVQIGLRRTKGKRIVIEIDNADSYSAGAIVEAIYTDKVKGKQTVPAVVVDGAKGLLTLDVANAISGDVDIVAMTPYAEGEKFDLETPLGTLKLYYKKASAGSPFLMAEAAADDVRKSDGKKIAQSHRRPTGVVGLAYAPSSGKTDSGTVVLTPNVGSKPKDHTVRFQGTPPKSLQQGAWYVARPVGTSALTELKVTALRMEADVYYVEFQQAPPAVHHKTEFFGPMTRELRPQDHNRSMEDAVSSGLVQLKALPAKARELVKVGRDVIVVYEKADDRRGAHAAITAIKTVGNLLELTLESDQDFGGWHAGWTRFHLNTVDISHGETQDPKILGSGDAEIRRQHFQFKITDVSFIPSNTAVTGVAPDMDVTVGGVKWEFRDFGDQTAEEMDAWSMALNEDDTLQIHFRRRLPTATNNIAVSRHRVGVGARGSGVPAWSITQPMKKNRYVTGIVQAFTTSGGADREPVAAIRDNAPSKLAANGRAVSLIDIEHLCKRHASVWQAKARDLIGPGAANQVDVVIVPADGGAVNSTLAGDLIDFVRNRALPNTRITITDHESLGLTVHVRIRVDTSRYEKSDVKDAVEAGLVTEFALKQRGLGQPVYVAEIMAAMERITGVSSATITDFAVKPGPYVPLREATVAGALAAVFPTEEQVAVISSVTDVTVDVEVLV